MFIQFIWVSTEWQNSTYLLRDQTLSRIQDMLPNWITANILRCAIPIISPEIFFFFLYSFLEMFESFPLEKCNKTFYYIWEQQYSIRARVHLQGFLSISFRQMSKGKHRSSTQELTNYETGICLKCQGFFSSKNIFKDTYLQAQKGFDFILIFSIRLRANVHRH